MPENNNFKKVYKSHSNFFQNEEEHKNISKIPLEELLNIYRNKKKSDFEFFKNFIKNDIELNYKEEFLKEKILSDEECIELFNVDYDTLSNDWKKKETDDNGIKKEESKKNIITIHYNPNSLEEKNIITISDENDIENIDEIKKNETTLSKPKLKIKSDGTFETYITLHTFLGK